MRNIMVLLSSILFALSETGIAAMASQDFATDSYNNSSISFIGQDKIISSPVDLSLGRGYYSSHPIAIGPAIGSRTNLANAYSATSMSHEVGFAQEISGSREYSAFSRSNQGEYENINSATTFMRIDENVTSGRVHIGVLSGSDDSAGKNGNAWKDPAIEMEEDYIGTYHIYKNFTINSSNSVKSIIDGWQSCCGEGYVVYPPEPVFISEDDVFNCLRSK